MGIKVLVISDYSSFHTVRPEAEIFISLSKLGVEVVIMTREKGEYPNLFRDSGIKVISFHPDHKLDKKEAMVVRNHLLEEKPDILYLFNSTSIATGLRAAKGIDVKVVLYRGYSGNIHWYDPTAYLKFLHPRADKIVCNSIGVERHINDQLFFDNRKTITINKGHKLEWYQGYSPLDIRTELGIESDALLLVCVANNRKMKGIPYLLKSLNFIPKDRKINLLLIGKDMETPSNLSILKKGGNEKRVHFLGFRKDALNIVSSCDCFVLASIKGESITKSVIEAMALGVAPIISDIWGNKELVESGVNGLVFKSKDSRDLAKKIMKVYENRSLIEKYGNASQRRIETVLSHKETVRKTLELFKKLSKKEIDNAA